MELLVEDARTAASPESPDPPVAIDYVNWRGERAIRQIVPRRMYRGTVEWHAGEQWLLDAWDVEKDAMRSFAMCDIVQWDVGRATRSLGC